LKPIFNLLFTLSLFCLISCEKDTINPQDDDQDDDNNYCEFDTFIVNNYKQDAKYLYFHEFISDSSHPNFNNPLIDSCEVIKFLEIIQSVYNLNSPQSDTIFNIYKIHGYYCYAFKWISLKVKTELPEIINLSNGIIPAGASDLDILLTTYHFDSVKTSYYYPRVPWITIFTHEEYNMIPLERRFSDLPQILNASFSKACLGDGDNISVTRKNDSATITFSIGWGDCPSGCIFRKYWEFNVKDGMATFVKTYDNQ